ncbi:hypothetical protein BJX61DRAFT_543273 [Aspergillus egyptiacus]|nr:hypothetical protein BJX61DRAFT_543273 [Aspergillus egyptiacus]
MPSSPSPSSTLNLYLAITPQDKCNPGQPRHWALLLSEPQPPFQDATECKCKCTIYHVRGGPWFEPFTPYRRSIEPGQRLDSWAFESTTHIGSLPVSARGEVQRAAEAVEPGFCQRYVVEVLRVLDCSGVGVELREGVVERLEGVMEVDEIPGLGLN